MIPSLDYQRGRETAAIVEKHYWRSRLEALADGWTADAKAPSIESPDSELVLLRCANQLAALLAERP